MLHVPEQYPVILFIEKEAKDEIKTVLNENDIARDTLQYDRLFLSVLRL